VIDSGSEPAWNRFYLPLPPPPAPAALLPLVVFPPPQPMLLMVKTETIAATSAQTINFFTVEPSFP
jgi:hypothetical protein